MEDENIQGTLLTEYDELNFSNGDAYANPEGNICIKFDDKNFTIFTPVMAKRLNKLIDEAVRESLGMVLGQE